MKALGIVLLPVLAGALLISSTAVDGQTATRVRGTVSAFDGKVLSVKTRDGKDTDVRVGDKTRIIFAQPIAIGDIRPGDFLGVTSSKGADGTLTAFEIRRFPKPLNPGHRPFDGREDQTMTNAAVATVAQAAKGRELTLTYEGGAQKIVVPEGASISMLVPGERSQLVPGAIVNLTAAPGAGGTMIARRIQISTERSKPPR